MPFGLGDLAGSDLWNTYRSALTALPGVLESNASFVKWLPFVHVGL